MRFTPSILEAIRVRHEEFVAEVLPEETRFADIMWPAISDRLGESVTAAEVATGEKGLGVLTPGAAGLSSFVSLVALGRLIARVQAELTRPSQKRVHELMDEVAAENSVAEALLRKMHEHFVPYVAETNFFEMRSPPGKRRWQVILNGAPTCYGDAEVESAMNDDRIEAILDGRTRVLSMRLAGHSSKPITLSRQEFMFVSLLFMRFPRFVARDHFRTEWEKFSARDSVMTDENINIIVHRLRKRLGSNVERPILVQPGSGHRLDVTQCLLIRDSPPVDR